MFLLRALCIAFAVGGIAATAPAQSIDLDRPYNYAFQLRPPYILRDNTPPGNPITNNGATLGRVLFHDKRLSFNNTISCASCHQQGHAFSDPSRASVGVNGSPPRRSMRLVNIRFAEDQRMFWNRRSPSLENQSTQPIRDHVEMGFSGQGGAPTFEDLVRRMQGTHYYPPLFTAAFGTPEITEDRMQRALAQFVRSIQSFDSKYDAGRIQAPSVEAPFTNYTASENAGKALFLAAPQFTAEGLRSGGGAGCAACHRLPEFDIDPRSRGNGVLGSLAGGVDRTNTRSPSLRNITDPQGNAHGPFMHDGSLPTLRSVVEHYNAIPAAAALPANAPSVDARLLPGGNPQRLQLTEQEMSDIVAFMQTLGGGSVYTDPKWSDPFDERGNLILIGLPAESGAWVAY